jgi:hypothetical protein
MGDRVHDILKRAYELWEQSGKTDGNHGQEAT